jgi:Protein of unknown function (DUF3035)
MNKARTRHATIVLGAALLGLGACTGTVQENLGLGKRSPDEFQVVRRAPLILPPDYSLRPPEPGAPGPAAQDTASQAEQILTGQPRLPPVDTTQSQGELTLLAQTNVETTPGIRQVLVQEDADLVSLDDSRFLFILNFQRRAMTPSGPVIDPVAETQRLQQAAAGTGSVITQRTGSEPLAP